jgi:hypothetical protein
MGLLSSAYSQIVINNVEAINMKIKLLFLSLLVIFLGLLGCATSSRPPLPATLNIQTPSPDIPAEIAAFVGIWEGKYGAIQNTIIVIEKIDNQKAELIYSLGDLEKFVGHYKYYTASVLPGPIIEFRDDTKLPSSPDGIYKCPCKLTIKLTDDKDMMISYWEWIDHKMKNRADLRRRK